jgi:hypothetical protein
MIYPITFSIPSEKIVNKIPEKKKLLAHIYPGRKKTYIFNKEKDYYKDYQISYFAITKKKNGWDCLRHYEIMANGCIPVFLNIKKCPPKTMYLLPKELFFEGNKLYDKLKHKKINELTEEEIIECNLLIEKLLTYLRNNLTTDKLASYILKKTNNKNVENILYLSKDLYPDYLRCLTLHGFKILLKNKCQDYPKIPHIYKRQKIKYSKLYGKGMTYTKLLNIDYHTPCSKENIKQNIINKKYDIIIYGSFHRGMPFYDLVKKKYNRNKIILLCGEDIHICKFKKFKKHPIFIRELQ